MAEDQIFLNLNVYKSDGYPILRKKDTNIFGWCMFFCLYLCYKYAN